MTEPKMTKAEFEAAKKIHLAMRMKRPLAAYARNEDTKEIYLDLMTTTALLCGALPEEDAIANFRNCLRWVRGESEAAEPKPPPSMMQ